MNMCNRQPDIENLYRVLRGEKPARPTLFELFMNIPLYERVTERPFPHGSSAVDGLRYYIDAFAGAGYDYVTTFGCGMNFKKGEFESKQTRSLNEGTIITDQASYDAYQWRDPEAYDYSHLRDIEPYLPDGMRLMVMGPGGVLENVMALVGYENLCYMMYEDPDLAGQIFDDVGSRLLRYYELSLQHDTVGLIMSNDDWGFNTQTFFPLDMMRKHVLPWHKRIVKAASDQGKPTVLHSCGFFTDIMADVIEIGFAGKHSYEDNILSVEDSYDRWHSHIAILGGIDVDFLIRSDEETITARSHAMLERADAKGAYALGSGNSIPAYIPAEKYFAMTRAAFEF